MLSPRYSTCGRIILIKCTFRQGLSLGWIISSGTQDLDKFFHGLIREHRDHERNPN